MARKKMKLKKRSYQSQRLHKEFEMPSGMGSEDSIVGFRNGKELRDKYFTFTGRVARRPYVFRTLLLLVAQFMFTLILYSKIVESIIIGRSELAWMFGLLLLLLSVPTIWAQLALGWRRCHDLNQRGLLFVIPYLCYLGSYVLPIWGIEGTITMAVQSITAISFLYFFTVKGTTGDNAYGPERSR